MAHSLFYEYRKNAKTMPQKAVNPLCCWVIFSDEGDGIVVLEEGLPIFMEWKHAQDFIEENQIKKVKAKLLVWKEVVKKAKETKIVQEIILDIGFGAFLSFPVKE